MKTIWISTIILFTLSLFIFLPHTDAVDTSEWSLPEGAQTRLGNGWINGVTYSSDLDGTLLAVASSIGIWLYDADTGEEQAFLTGHTAYVNSVSFSPDGETLASGSDDHTVRLWDVATSVQKAVFTGHTEPVNSVHFSPDSKTLASGSDDNYVYLWDIATETRKNHIGHRDDVNSVRFSPDGETLASGSDDNYVYLWDVATGTQKASLSHGWDDVYSVSWSPDGKTLATACDDHRYAYLWDAGTGAFIDSLEGGEEVHRVSFSSDGKTVATGGPSGTVRLWNVETRTEKSTLIGHANAIRGLSFSRDGTLATASWDKVRLWNAATGAPKPTFTKNNDAAYYASFSPTGPLLATSNYDGTVTLWDVETKTRKSTLQHGDELSYAFFSPDGKTLASQTWGGTLRLWDIETATEKASFNDVYSASFSPDSTLFATGHYGTVVLWDVATGRREATFPAGQYNNSLNFSPDGKTLASANTDDAVYLWDVATLARKATLWHGDDVNSVHFSPDSKTLASASEDRTVRLWDVETLKQKAELSHNRTEVGSVHFSPDGSTLASVDFNSWINSWLNTMYLWDVATGTRKATLSHDANLNSYNFSPDGTTLATASEDNYVRLWDVATGTRKATLTGHTGSVYNVNFSPDGETLASGSDDGSVLLWEFSSMRTVSITPPVVASPAIGEQLTVQVSIDSGSNVGGYQATVEFDPTALRYVESANGDYLPEGAFFVAPIVGENTVQIGGTSLSGVSQKASGALATLTFRVLAVKESILNLNDVILTDNEGEHLPHFTVSGRVVEPEPLASSAIVRVTPVSAISPEVGETLVFSTEIVGGENIVDYHLKWDYDNTALEYVSSDKGSYVPEGGVGSGDGTLATATFRVKVRKTSTVSVSGILTTLNGLPHLPTFESAQVIAPVFGDVNRDGQVNIQDLVLVASSFGQPVPTEGHPADVNEDGQINIIDLVKVAGALGTGAAAPLALNQHLAFAPTRAEVEQWLTVARQANLTDAISERGIRFLEQLLAVLTPKETVLLPNYPNPFNPETWIPYQLAKPADVALTIYDIQGRVVRDLDLGHQRAGIYQSRARAAHWDGRNAQGESVASGVYFYTLTAGEFTATRKMLIRK